MKPGKKNKVEREQKKVLPIIGINPSDQYGKEKVITIQQTTDTPAA